MKACEVNLTGLSRLLHPPDKNMNNLGDLRNKVELLYGPSLDLPGNVGLSSGLFNTSHHFSNLGIQTVFGFLLQFLEFRFVVLLVPLAIGRGPLGVKRSGLGNT